MRAIQTKEQYSAVRGAHPERLLLGLLGLLRLCERGLVRPEPLGLLFGALAGLLLLLRLLRHLALLELEPHLLGALEDLRTKRTS